MITYDLTETKFPLYKALYELIKTDISKERLTANKKMPSKRTFAAIWELVPPLQNPDAFGKVIYINTFFKITYINNPHQLHSSALIN